MKLDFDDGLSPDEAAVVAVLLNPALRAARAERGLAAAQLLRAGLLPNPELSGNLEFPIATEGEVVGYGVGIFRVLQPGEHKSGQPPIVEAAYLRGPGGS